MIWARAVVPGTVAGSAHANEPRLPECSGTTGSYAAALEVAATDWALADGRLLGSVEALGEALRAPHPARRTQLRTSAAQVRWWRLADSVITGMRSSCWLVERHVRRLLFRRGA